MKLFSYLAVCGVVWSVSLQAALPAYDAEGTALPSLAPLLEEVNPAVVNISTFTSRPVQPNTLGNDPYSRRFYGNPGSQGEPSRQRIQSAGSGVIVDADKGIIITNHHVVHGADEIHIGLNDGRSLIATLVGSDPEVDIAVLELQDFKGLTAMDIANSDTLRQGDFVIAIGNPFGLGHTVTQGIISALGRSGLGIEGYENFIQTDASINPGNSGGALVNLRGELVGINTAIFAPSGGNVGIGFAIPMNMANASIEQILAHGEVKRGVLGVVIQDLTPALVEVFELDRSQHGVVIADVQHGSAAQDAGLEPGDIVTSIDGDKLTSSAQLRNHIGIQRIGDTVSLSIIRDGEPRQLKAKVGQPVTVSETEVHPLFEGVDFEESPQEAGLLVTGIAPNSAGASTGLRPGDVLLSYNRHKINSAKQLYSVADTTDRRIVLRIKRANTGLYLVIQ
jgi:Do/DeqQ family serine protease